MELLGRGDPTSFAFLANWDKFVLFIRVGWNFQSNENGSNVSR